MTRSTLVHLLSRWMGGARHYGFSPFDASRGAVYLAKRLALGDALALRRLLGHEPIWVILGKTSSVGWGSGLLQSKRARNTFDAAQLASLAHQQGRATVVIANVPDPVTAGVELAHRSHLPVIPFAAAAMNIFEAAAHAHPLHWDAFGQRLLHFSAECAPAGISPDLLRKAFLDLSSRVYESHPLLERHLAEEIVRFLKEKPFRIVVTDAFQGGRSMRGIVLLAAGWLLAEWLKENASTEKRIGIVLPPGLGATIANLACVLADKVPVNLNFTMGTAANRAAIQKAGLVRILSSQAFTKKLPDFPWTGQLHDLGDILKSIGKNTILLRALQTLLTPTGKLLDGMRIPKRGDFSEAGLLFTSGSSGDPKGVPLSHRNILTNCAQIHRILPRESLPAILGCLPVFHSFGFTVTLWWPLLGGPRVVTYVSPLETGKLIEIIEKYEIALMITTPTFLRGLFKKAGRRLRGLRMIVTGAEKLPTPLKEEAEKILRVPVCQGYGMTEGSPVISTNLTDEVARSAGLALPAARTGSVGRPVPGLSIRVKSIEMEEDLPLNQTGMLWFRGGNIFRGYLDQPDQTDAVLRDGWYCSGDLGRVDEDGFLHIEGRLSRFSKIGGEMVPHGTVEHHLLEILQPQFPDGIALAVVGIRDERKGESLVLLSNRPIDETAVRKELAARGLPNLWIPRLIRIVEEIPTLASGKLNLRACEQLAHDLAENTGS